MVVLLFFLVLSSSSLAAFRRLPTSAIWALVALCLLVASAASAPRAWNVYHYGIGTRYFAELGYADLYECTLVATGQTQPRRDLRDYAFRTDAPDCAAPFTPDRWNAFQRDVQSVAVEPGMLMDKGLNATPTWIALLEPLLQWSIPFTLLLDPVVLGGALLLCGRLVGWRRTGYAALFLVTFVGTYDRLFGNVGQYLALGLLLAASALLQVGRDRAGGALLGIAAALRIYPVLLLIGRRWQAVGWAVGAGALALLIGLGTSRGAAAYPAFVENMSLHAAYIRTEPANIGLANMVFTSLSLDDAARAYRVIGAGEVHQVSYRTPWWLVALLAPAVASTPYGIIFAALTLSRYYYTYLAVVALEREEGAIRALLGGNAVLLVWITFWPVSGATVGQLVWLLLLAAYWRRWQRHDEWWRPLRRAVYEGGRYLLQR